MGRKRKPLTVRERVHIHRAKMRSLGYRYGWVPFKGMEAIGKEKIKRKPRMIPLSTRNGRKKGTWLKETPKRTSGPKRKGSFR